jgi:hypothetical protein
VFVPWTVKRLVIDSRKIKNAALLAADKNNFSTVFIIRQIYALICPFGGYYQVVIRLVRGAFSSLQGCISYGVEKPYSAVGMQRAASLRIPSLMHFLEDFTYGEMHPSSGFGHVLDGVVFPYQGSLDDFAVAQFFGLGLYFRDFFLGKTTFLAASSVIIDVVWEGFFTH